MAENLIHSIRVGNTQYEIANDNRYYTETEIDNKFAVQNIKHYSSLEQLNLTAANGYLDVIANAMPSNSVFQMSTNDNTVKYDEASGKTKWNYPSTNGTLRIVKVSGTRCYAEFTAHKSSSRWIGAIYNNSDTLTFYGWEKTPKQSEIVPITRKVNNKALDADITLTPADVGALKVYNSMEELGTTWDNCTPSIIFNAMAIPSILMVRSPNDFPLGSQDDFGLPTGMESLTVMKFNSINATFHADDIRDNAGYVGVYDNNKWYGWKGYVPETRTINGKALSSNIILSASDVGALPNTTVIPSNCASLAGTNNYTNSSKNVFYANNGYSAPTDFKFVVGDSSSALVFGSDGLQCYSGTTSSTGKGVYLNYYGGDVIVGKANGNQTINLQGTVKENGIALSSKYAPAGYGLGTTVPPLLADGNAMTPAGFYRITNNTLNMNGATKYSGIVFPYSGTEAVQMHIRTTHGGTRFRRTTDGGKTWVSEWLNPALVDNTEYQTIERSGSKSVYVKHIPHTFSTQIGSESGSGDIQIEHGITDFGGLVRIVATDWSDYQLPYFSATGGFLAIKGVDETYITLRYNKAALAAREMYFDVYYIKG